MNSLILLFSSHALFHKHARHWICTGLADWLAVKQSRVAPNLAEGRRNSGDAIGPAPSPAWFILLVLPPSAQLQ